MTAARVGSVATIEHFRARVLQDALAEALPDYWRRRAATFARVGTPVCDDTARACRRHAGFIEREGLPRFVLEELVAALDDSKETG